VVFSQNKALNIIQSLHTRVAFCNVAGSGYGSKRAWNALCGLAGH